MPAFAQATSDRDSNHATDPLDLPVIMIGLLFRPPALCFKGGASQALFRRRWQLLDTLAEHAAGEALAKDRTGLTRLGGAAET